VSDSQVQQPHDGESNLRLSLPGVHFPDSSRVADQFLNTNAARSSAFLNLTQANSLLDHGLSQLGSLSEQDRGHVVNAVGSLILNVLYPPFVYTHAQSQQESSQAASEPEIYAIPMSGLRQRRGERSDSAVSVEECRF
jgi:hypothetical protein